MRYYINRELKESAYIQLYRQIRTDIVNSVYKFGDKLPSKRTLASESQSSVITVEHAYDILMDEGYIETRERSGYFVIYRKKDFVPVDENETKIEHYQKQEHNDEIFPFSVLAKTMRNVISKYSERLLIKSPNMGTLELQEAICNYLAKSKGLHVLPKQIVIGSGAEYLYSLIVQLLGKDKIFGIENPSYVKISSVYRANEVELDELAMGNEGILTTELNRTKATVLHVTPFCSYPSGVSASVSKRNEYIKWATDRNGMIIEDDFNSEFTVSRKNEDTVFSLEPKKTVIYVNTFSQTIAPSIRVGYMVLPIELVDLYLKKIGFYSCTVPVFEQYLLAQLLNNGDFERHINHVRRLRRQKLNK